MRLLVTGGAGYIGSVVVEELVRQGHEVTIFDDLSTGHREALHPDCAFVEGNLLNADSVSRAMSRQTEGVLHFAAKSLVAESMQNPALYYAHNVGGAASLLSAMQKHGVERIVFSSTAAVYGEPEVSPIHEATPEKPTHAYGGSKRSIEMMFEHAMKSSGLRAVFLRYFNAAGASVQNGEDHDPESHLIPNLLNSATDEKKTMRIFGDDYDTPDGTCVRDYIHVLDLAKAHVLALQALDQGVTGPLNLGTGRGSSVLEVLESARQVTGCPIPSTMESRRPGDPPILVADSSRAQEILQWKPEFTEMRAIVQSAWDWMAQHPRGYDS